VQFFAALIDSSDPAIQRSNYFTKVTPYEKCGMSQSTQDSDRCDRYESNLLAIAAPLLSLLTVDHVLQRTLRFREQFLSVDDRSAMTLGLETLS
jgi:hypothetical protein